jgi:hypothetical protein
VALDPAQRQRVSTSGKDGILVFVLESAELD